MILVPARAADIEKKFSQVEVFLLPGNPVKFYQSHFHNLMSGPDVIELVGFGTESVAEEIGFLEGNVKKVGFASGLIMGGGGFEEMTGVIEFVAINRIHLPTLVPGPAMGIFGIDRAGRVQVAVRFLRFADFRDEIVQVSGHFG